MQKMATRCHTLLKTLHNVISLHISDLKNLSNKVKLTFEKNWGLANFKFWDRLKLIWSSYGLFLKIEVKLKILTQNMMILTFLFYDCLNIWKIWSRKTQYSFLPPSFQRSYHSKVVRVYKNYQSKSFYIFSTIKYLL